MTSTAHDPETAHLIACPTCGQHVYGFSIVRSSGTMQYILPLLEKLTSAAQISRSLLHREAPEGRQSALKAPAVAKERERVAPA